MKRNIYLELLHQGRSNPIKLFIYSLFANFVCAPRLLLEVHTRSQFGERYFSFSRAWIYAFLLGAPPIFYLVLGIFKPYFFDFTVWDFFLHYTTWYVFIYLFLKKCIEHRKEIKKYKAEFDFKRYTISSGVIDQRLVNFKYKGRTFDSRTIQTIIEPGLFLIMGLGLTILTQWIGIVIMFCSICYSVSYFFSYKLGDDAIMDIIDNIIANEQTSRIIREGKKSAETNGFEMNCELPNDPELAAKLSDIIVQKEEIIYAI